MICKVCGRTIGNEEANFCEYCGASFRPGMDNRILEEDMHKHAGYTTAGNQSYQQQAFGNYQTAQTEQNQTYAKDQIPHGAAKEVTASRGGGFFSGKNATMTFGNWMIIYLLPFIPMVGTILFLVLLFSWGFGSNVVPTKKSWARATLVFVLIMIVIMFALMSGGFMGDYATMLEGIYGM